MSVYSVKNSYDPGKGSLLGSPRQTHEPSPSPFLPIRSDRGWGRPLPGRVVRVPAVYNDPLLSHQNSAPHYGAFARPDTERDSRIGKTPRRRPEFGPGAAGAEAAKLEKFSDASGSKFSGCPTLAEPILESRAVHPALPKPSVGSEFLQSEFQIDLALSGSRREIAYFNSRKLSSLAKDQDFRKRLEKEVPKLRQIEAAADKPNGIPPECREQLPEIRANLQKLEEILEALQKYDDCNCIYDAQEECSWYFTGCVHEESCPMGVCARLVCTVTCPIWGALACLSACNAKICEGLLGPQKPEDLKVRPATPPKLVYTQYAVASTPANPRGFGYQ